MKQVDTYLKDLEINDTIVVRDKVRHGESSYEDLYVESPNVDEMIDMVGLYQ